MFVLQPDRSQVESRLNQIRDYIRVTSTMMDSLNQSSDPVSINIIYIILLYYKYYIIVII